MSKRIGLCELRKSSKLLDHLQSLIICVTFMMLVSVTFNECTLIMLLQTSIITSKRRIFQ